MGAVAMTAPAAPRKGRRNTILFLQVAMILATIVLWEAVVMSGLFYYGVFPSFLTIMKALSKVLVTPVFYWHLMVTVAEVLAALICGGLVGAVVGFAFGRSWFLSKAFENYVYYLSSTPKIIFFPVVITWFGVDSGSKVGLGAIAAFFPVCLNIATGIRGINPIWIRAAQSYQVTQWQAIWKIYVPAMRGALVNAFRLGLAVTIISVLLAETKLARNGIGFMVDQAYGRYDMPTMYALILFIFVASILVNTVLSKWGGTKGPRGAFS